MSTDEGYAQTVVLKHKIEMIFNGLKSKEQDQLNSIKTFTAFLDGVKSQADKLKN
jgi:hypothetical protein